MVGPAVTTNEIIFRFGRNSHRMPHTTRLKSNNESAVTTMGNQILRQEQSKHETIFNDYALYESLCQEDGVVKVEIHTVCVKHNHRFCQGLQVIYKSTFFSHQKEQEEETDSTSKNKSNRRSRRDATTKLTRGKEHLFANGIYARGYIQSANLVLQDGEFISDLIFYQGVVVDGIEFLTNRRAVHIGGDGGLSTGLGKLFPSPLPTEGGKIIAFAGTACGVLQRVGYYYATTSPCCHNLECRDHYHYSPCSRKHAMPVIFSFADRKGFERTCVFVAETAGSPSTEQHQMSNGFVLNDFLCYKSLCRRPGCKKVEISSVRICHMDASCEAFEVTYRLTYDNGITQIEPGPRNFFKRFIRYPTNSKWLHLDLDNDEEGAEYIRGIDIYKGARILHGLTLITNRRVFHCGGKEGKFVRLLAPGRSMGIVAFAGILHRDRNHHRSLKRIGYYTTSMAWDAIGHFVMSRKLLLEGRAEPIENDGSSMCNEGGTLCRLLHLPDGLFNEVLTFLF